MTPKLGQPSVLPVRSAAWSNERLRSQREVVNNDDLLQVTCLIDNVSVGFMFKFK